MVGQVRFVMSWVGAGQIHGLGLVGVDGSRGGPQTVQVSWHPCHALHQDGPVRWREAVACISGVWRRGRFCKHSLVIMVVSELG